MAAVCSIVTRLGRAVTVPTMTAPEGGPPPLIDWSRSELRWTPDGYELRVRHRLDQRALGRFRDDLQAANPTWSVIATASSSSYWGELELTSDSLLKSDPHEMRVSLDRLASRVHSEASRQAEEDDRRIEQFLDRLLEPDEI